ncbi:MAG TPA: hypothetical protein VN626_00265 [Clostridia bacterium]|nr:hypothetical protein [Clostridia bacterium]
MSVTLFISDTKIENNRLHFCKTIVAYLLIALLALLISIIYGFFSHDVASPWMTWMFLYPLVGGALCFTFLGLAQCKVRRVPGYRLFFNAYNSGIATLTVSSFLKGVFDIAGTGSPYVGALFSAGWVFLAYGVIVLLVRPHQKEQL